MINLKKLITGITMLLYLLPVVAQEKADSTYLFRFRPETDMFYVPWHDNAFEFERLLRCIEQHKTAIFRCELPLYVDGYCQSQDNHSDNLAIAKIRANRVKSELIMRKELVDSCFITHNHTSGGDYVTVRIVLPVVGPTETGLVALQKAEAARVSDEQTAQTQQKSIVAEKRKAEQSKTELQAAEQAEQTYREATHLTPEQEADVEAKPYTFFLRTNLLRLATLTPDLGIEWHFTSSWGILLNGSWTSWTWNDKDRRYALWEVMPEVRYYIGKEKHGYLGAMFKTGQFNYKFSEIGRQGDLMGGGITGGYQLQLKQCPVARFQSRAGLSERRL